MIVSLLKSICILWFLSLLMWWWNDDCVFFFFFCIVIFDCFRWEKRKGGRGGGWMEVEERGCLTSLFCTGFVSFVSCDWWDDVMLLFYGLIDWMIDAWWKKKQERKRFDELRMEVEMKFVLFFFFFLWMIQSLMWWMEIQLSLGFLLCWWLNDDDDELLFFLLCNWLLCVLLEMFFFIFIVCCLFIMEFVFSDCWCDVFMTVGWWLQLWWLSVFLYLLSEMFWWGVVVDDSFDCISWAERSMMMFRCCLSCTCEWEFWLALTWIECNGVYGCILVVIYCMMNWKLVWGLFLIFKLMTGPGTVIEPLSVLIVF